MRHIDQLKNISIAADFHDENLCPLKPDQNGGDVLHRIGLQAIEWWLRTTDNLAMRAVAQKQFESQLYLHYKGNGNFCRYHKATRSGSWWTYPTTMSRDQSIPIIAACGLYRMDVWTDRIYEGLKQRGGFYTNTTINNQPGTQKVPDCATPQIWAMLDRAKGIIFHSGSITDGDRLELADSKVICAMTSPPKVWLPWPISRWSYPMGKPVLHSDPINKTVVLLFNKMTWETRDAQLARQIYAKKGRVLESWDAYWNRGPSDVQCPFDKFFKPYIASLGRDELL